VTLEDNIAYKQWLKLAINCVINPITAWYDIDNGLVNEAKFTDKIEKLLVEIVAVAKTQGVVLDKDELESTVQKVALTTAKNCSSMRCDILAKRKTEIDYINGYIHQIGQKNALATPENTKMWQAIKNIELYF
jgi:2-dehydropantoate 2-reductase